MQDMKSLEQQLKYASDDERTQLLAAIEERENHLKVLNQFAISINQITSYEDLVWHVAKGVVAQLGFADCVLYKLNSADQTLVQQAAIGEKSPIGRKIINPLRIPVGAGVTGRVAAQAMPIIVKDLSKYPGYVADISPALSEICVPLSYDGKVLGVIDCENPAVDHFKQKHLEILISIAALTSSKINQLEITAKQAPQNTREQLAGQNPEAGGTTDITAPAEAVTPHILIAEDNDVNQMLIRRFVERFGWSCSIVANGKEALAALKSGTLFDLILMDIRMPLMDGLTATTEIRALDGPVSDIPIVALTANSDPEDAAQYLSAGMNAVVSKPIEKEKLHCAVEGLIAKCRG